MILGLSDYDSYLKFFAHNDLFLRHHKLFGKPDVNLKWGFIFTNLKKYIKPNDSIIDLGAGDLALAVSTLEYFKDLNLIYNCFDLNRYSINNYLQNPFTYKQFMNRIVLNLKIIFIFFKFKPKLSNASHIEYLKSIPSESVDVVIDSCSMIHFDSGQVDLEGINDGIKQTIFEIQRILKKGGHFFTVCDVQIPDKKHPQFISTEILNYKNLRDYLLKNFKDNSEVKTDSNCKIYQYTRVSKNLVIRFNVCAFDLVKDY
jgi:hypothetical protein